jgi:16S rRNA C1402 N4-methylase RsmH
LDLRFDISKGDPAWKLLETLSRVELASILAKYGDGQDAETAERIADTIALYKSIGKGMPKTTSEFSDLVSRCRMGGDYQRMHAAKLTFQALRMHINSERKEMMRGMNAAFKMLKEGGRIAVISWKHSEAALLMDFLREHELAAESYPLRAWLEESDEGLSGIKRKYGLRRAPAIYPSAAELGYNSRARSAVLHILVKEKGVRVSEVTETVYEKMHWEQLNVPRLHST